MYTKKYTANDFVTLVIKTAKFNAKLEKTFKMAAIIVLHLIYATALLTN